MSELLASIGGSQLWLGLIVVLALLAVGWFLSARWSRWRDRWRRVRRQRIATSAEKHAEKLLRRAGFSIVDRQVTGTWILLVDGEPATLSCRADLVVKRGGQTFIAEVKSGTVGARPTHPATRRQLLEYRMAFEVDGVLLVDVPASRVMEVTFPDH